MFVVNNNFEEEMIWRLTMKEYIGELEPEIQDIFYESYGENFEALPKRLINLGMFMEELIKRLVNIGNIKSQKLILMRFGIVTGSPMTLEEVASELGITREKVREIESLFLRKSHPSAHHRRKKLIDYLNE